MESLILVAIMLLFTWVLFIRPQQKRIKRHQELVAGLMPGDRVVTAGGLLGTVAGVLPEEVLVRVADGVELRLLPGAITRKVEPEVDGPADEPAVGE